LTISVHAEPSPSLLETVSVMQGWVKAGYGIRVLSDSTPALPPRATDLFLTWLMIPENESVRKTPRCSKTLTGLHAEGVGHIVRDGP
jgi:hypothetical protein